MLGSGQKFMLWGDDFCTVTENIKYEIKSSVYIHILTLFTMFKYFYSATRIKL